MLRVNAGVLVSKLAIHALTTEYQRDNINHYVKKTDLLALS
jgi:hypothetical protein